MPDKDSSRGFELNAAYLIPRGLLSTNDYTTIQDVASSSDALEENASVGVHSHEKPTYSKYKPLALSGILLSAIIFVVAILFIGQKSSLLGQSLGRITAFRQVVHPEPPSPLWGTVVKPFLKIT